MMRALALSVSAALAVLLLAPRPAHAYLDPSTGSMLVSALISIGVTTGLALQAYGYKLLALLRRLLGRELPAQADPDARERAEPGP